MTLEGLDEPVRRYFEHALHGDAERARGVRLEMKGCIRAGAWLPFCAQQESDGRSFTWRARVGVGRLALLTVVDGFAAGAGTTEGRLFGRRRVLRSEGTDTSRSAAGRAALEAVFAPMSLLPDRGVTWRAEDETLIAASLDSPPSAPSCACASSATALCAA